MRKLYLLVVAFAFCIAQVNAQYYYIPSTTTPGNPGGINTIGGEYPAGSGLDASWTSILSGNNATPAWTQTQTIPFSFDFNGTAVTDYKVSSSGVLTFTTSAATAPGYTNGAIPDASIPDNSIMIWGIAGTGANDEIVTQTFGSAGARQHWIFFPSYTAGGSWSYWSIVLEETTNYIYIVDQRHGGSPTVTAGIQISSTEAYSVSGSPSLSNLAGTAPDDTDNYYYEFRQGTLPGDNIALSSISTPTIGTIGSNVSIAGTITNLGGNTVTSVDVTWDDGSGANTETIGGLNIPTYGTYNFTHGTALTVGSTHNMNICAQITGVQDLDTSDNCTSHTVSGLAFTPTRHVVIEEGTGTWCGWCPRGAVAMETLNSDASRPNFIGIAVHNGDPMTVTAYDNGANFSGFPGMNVNRKYLGESVSTTAMQDFYDQASAEPTNCDVAVTATYDAGGSITAEVTATFAAEVTTEHRLAAVLVENGVVGTGSGYDQSNYYSFQSQDIALVSPNSGGMPNFDWQGATNPVSASEMVYDHVGRELYGGYDGQASSISLPAAANSSQSYTFSGTVGSYNPAKCHVVGLIINSSTGEIMNANEASMSLVGLQENSLVKLFNVFPNPTKDLAVINFNLDKTCDVTVEITDMTGKVIFSRNLDNASGFQNVNINVGNMNNGIYFVNLKTDANILSKKLTVNK